MGAWAKAQDIDDNDKRFSERYVARQDHKVTMLADARRYPCEINQCLAFFETSIHRRLRAREGARPRSRPPEQPPRPGGPAHEALRGAPRCRITPATRLLDSHRSVSTQAFYDDGVLKALSVAEGPKGADGLHSDPAGDDAPESTFAENFLKTI